MSGRSVPKRTEAQQRTHERRAALATLNVAQLRAWAEKWGGALLGDDQTVLQSAHEARVLDTVMSGFLRRESVRWLREHAPDSDALLTERQIVARLRKRRR